MVALNTVGSAVTLSERPAYTKALREAFPEGVPVDANSTLRLTYGKVEGSAPYDGMQCNPRHGERHLQKYVPGDPDFDMPERLWNCFATRVRTLNSEGDLVVCLRAATTPRGKFGSGLGRRRSLGGINFGVGKHHERHLV